MTRRATDFPGVEAVKIFREGIRRRLLRHRCTFPFEILIPHAEYFRESWLTPLPPTPRPRICKCNFSFDYSCSHVIPCAHFFLKRPATSSGGMIKNNELLPKFLPVYICSPATPGEDFMHILCTVFFPFIFSINFGCSAGKGEGLLSDFPVPDLIKY